MVDEIAEEPRFAALSPEEQRAIGGFLSMDLLPAGGADAIASHAPHGFDQLVIEDAAIVGPSDRAEFDPTILDLERLDLLGTVEGQAALQVDPGKRHWELAEIGGECSDDPTLSPKDL